jgi:tetratricopeptide (TPR) repeat protein
MRKYIEAEDYLSLAKWSILKSQHVDNLLISKLHRNFGQLYAAQELYDKALHQLALDVYHSSLATNPEDLSVTGGYYQIGIIFQKKSRSEDAAAFFDKVVQIWSTLWNPQLSLGIS